MGRRVAEPALESRVRALRITAGLSQQELARAAGLSRQAVNGIENGRYVPNTAVALRLARELRCRVEDLFGLGAPEAGSIELVGRSPANARRVAVAKVGERWVGYPLAGGADFHEGFAGADALLPTASGEGAEILTPREVLERSALLLGCDLALGVLCAHTRRYERDARLLWLAASSSSALDALGRGEAHIAGTHLHDVGTGQDNISQARAALGPGGGLVLAFARWEQGLVVPPGNPKGLRNAPDLARPDVLVINREPGSGSRALLDELLSAAGIPVDGIWGYDRVVHSHLAVARAIASGGADAGIAPLAAARALGLGFVALGEVRFDLVIPHEHSAHAGVTMLAEVLQSRALRAELEALPGYVVGDTGTTVAEFAPAA